ncbi:glycosyltransferase family 4 protein [Sphingomonas sp. F9_3S_D5_B_2]
MESQIRPVILSANSSWNIVNFRAELISALEQAGFEPVVVAPVDPPAEKRMKALGVRRFEVNISRSGLNPFKDLALLLSYRRIIAEVRPAAYLGFTIKPNIYGCLAARFAGVPAIPNISGLGTVFIRGGLLGTVVSALYRIGLSRAPVVFFQNSDDLAVFIGRKLVRRDQARLLQGSGIDTDRFSPAPLPLGPVRFLFIGRLLVDKGVREFVEAARVLRAGGSDARFQLLGALDEGNRTAISRAELDSWVAAGAVEYLGEAEDVRPFIADSHVVVLPSYREGLPRSLLEGAAMGRPLIAADVPGCRDVVERGVNGFLCEARNAASLAEAMRKMLGLTTEQRAALGHAARERVQAKFNLSGVIAEYLRAIADVAPRRS